MRPVGIVRPSNYVCNNHHQWSSLLQNLKEEKPHSPHPSHVRHPVNLFLHQPARWVGNAYSHKGGGASSPPEYGSAVNSRG